MARLLTKRHIMFALLILLACRHEPMPAYNDGYPEPVGKIFRARCATSGCHNNKSYINAANLDMTTWERLFNGTSNGAVVIPYRPDFSSLCYFINTDTSLGVALKPTMPYNQPPLSRQEYLTITNWIAEGAPNADGVVKFSGNSDQEKIYIANKLCDVVTVMDAATLLPMRYIDVGVKPSQEFPHCIKVSPDKRHWYVSFFSITNIVQKFDAASDQPAGTLYLGEGAWTSFIITADSKHGYFVDNSSPGKIVYADLEHMSVITTYTFNDKLNYPIGAALSEQMHKLYVGTSTGNFIYSIDLTDALQPTLKEIPIDGSLTVQHHSMQNPTELLADKNTGHCFIACERSKELRVLDMKNNSIVAAVKLPANPAFMAYSKPLQKLFVSCPDDTSSFAGNRGSVSVIDLATMSVVKTINTGYQPCGLAISEMKNVVAVANANISIKGPASHHSSRCGERNGNVSFIDLNTLGLVPGKRIEVAVYPFGVTCR